MFDHDFLAKIFKRLVWWQTLQHDEITSEIVSKCIRVFKQLYLIAIKSYTGISTSAVFFNVKENAHLVYLNKLYLLTVVCDSEVKRHLSRTTSIVRTIGQITSKVLPWAEIQSVLTWILY